MTKEELKIRAQALLDASHLVHLAVMKTTDSKTCKMLQELYLDILKLLKG